MPNDRLSTAGGQTLKRYGFRTAVLRLGKVQPRQGDFLDAQATRYNAAVLPN